MKVRIRDLFLTAMVLFSVCLLQAAGQESQVRNGSFEQDMDGDGMADDWQFAGDSGVTAAWARDDGFVGRYSQRLSCTAFTSLSPASHAMLCQLDTLRLMKDQWYRISFAARQQGIPGGAVRVAISDTASWQNCGLNESFRAYPAWKEYEFVFKAAQAVSDHVRLQFWYTTTGMLWLDEVRLESSAPVEKRFTEVVPPATGVNLLRNSSFECGTSGWGSIADLPGWGGNLNLPVGSVDTTVRKFHQSSFRIALTPETIPVFYFDYFSLYRVPVTAPLLAGRGWIHVRPNADYTLSAYLKADSDDLIGVLSVRQAFRGALRKDVRLTRSWQRYSFTVQPQSDQVFVALGLDLEASGRETGAIWIDGVQLERGTQPTPYRTRSTVEVGIETGQLGNVFPHGLEPEMTAHVFNAGRTPAPINLSIRTTDFDDAVVCEADVGANVEPYGHVRLRIRPGVQRRGFYRLHMDSASADVALNRPMRLAIITPYAYSDSVFGMNHAYPWAHLLDLSRRIGLCWFRDWSLKWHEVEPVQGSFTFVEADHQIDRVLERGLQVLPLLPFPSGNWASSAPAEAGAPEDYPPSRERIAYMPRDLQAFGAYVRTTVDHYRDRLKVWEILNEPIYTSYALPRAKGYQVEDYVRLLKVACRAVKEADGEAMVVGGIASGPANYTREFIEAGGLQWVDALNLHSYPGLSAPDAYEAPLRQLRERMRSMRGEKPIWFTEGAYYADDDKPIEPYESTWLKPVESEVEAAEWQVKFNTLLLAYGTEKIIYHSGTPGSLNNESLSGIFFEWAGEPRKMLVTQAAMANLLVPPVRSLGPVDAPESVKAYGFQSRGRTVVVAWMTEGADPVNISLVETDWTGVGLGGNELPAASVAVTERPVYLVTNKAGLATLPW